MLTTDLDFRVKGNTKIISVGIAVREYGNFLVCLPETEEDSFTQFVLGIEQGDERDDRFVFLTAKYVPAGLEKCKFNDMCVRARDIRFIQKFEEDANG